MRGSDYLITVCGVMRVLFITAVTSLGVIWLNQRSLEGYWAVHFHRESPWAGISSPFWSWGARVMSAVQAAGDAFIAQYDDDGVIQVPVLPAPAAVTHSPERQDVPVNIFIIRPPQNEHQLSRMLTAGRQVDSLRRLPDISLRADGIAGALYGRTGSALLPADKKVLFIGDSMMEGVAPRVMGLLKKHRVTGINLSRRSTGLAYPGFFNWPETTSGALKDNPSTGLLVVFMGPNDPWDMPPAGNGNYLKFGSPSWQDEYRARIRRILTLAQQHEIPVIWVLPPNMRKEKLNQGMALLNRLYESEVTSSGGIVIRVNDVFGYPGMTYSDTAVINGRSGTVRARDGIHFTPAGADMIARAVMNRIHVIAEEHENGNDL